jgi:hypothetical protein
LGAQIAAIANGDFPPIDEPTRAEASQLAAEWHEAIDLPIHTFEEEQKRVSQMDSLQKRIIQILISASRS